MLYWQGRMYRWLLHLYPAEFQAEYSRELALVFDDVWRESPSVPSRWATFAKAMTGVIREAPKEHGFMLLQDVRHGFRLLRKDPGFTITALLVLALGIGSATTIFSLVNGLLLRPLPYPDQESLVYVDETAPKRSYTSMGVAFPNYLDLRERNRTLADIGVYTEGSATLTSGDGEAERAQVGYISQGVLPVLGVKPLLGRWFTPEEDRPKGPNVVLLGQNLWERRYGRNAAIVGQTIQLGDKQARVVGVMPTGFHFPNVAEMWSPLQIDPTESKRTDYFLSAVGRLRPGVTKLQATQDTSDIMRQIIAEHPEADHGQTVIVQPLHMVMASQYRNSVLILFGAVLSVLLIACVNVTNLLLARGSVRLREMAVRGALGASRIRLIRQLLVESLMLGLTGGLLGVLAAFAGVPLLLKLVPIQLPRWIQFQISSSVLAFAVILAVAAAILFGIAPAWLAARQDVTGALKDGAKGSGGRHRRWFRNALVSAEVALSFALLAGAALMIRTLEAVTTQELGFNPSNVLTMRMSTPQGRYGGDKARILMGRVREEVASLPGVTGFAVASGVPIANGWGRSFTVEGHPVLSLKDAPMINHTVVSPGYFKTLGIRMLEGRDFTDQDGAAEKFTIVDTSIARKYWPGASALGRRVRFGPPEDNEPWHIVIGVVDEVRNQSVTAIGRSSVYLAYNELPLPGVSLIARAGNSPQSLVKPIRERLAGLDRQIAVAAVQTMDEVIIRSIWQRRFLTIVLAVFAASAVLLAAIGLYGVLAQAVTQQRQELGIRMALGAAPASLRRMVLGSGLRLIGIGAIVGAGLTWLGTRLIATQLYKVSPLDLPSLTAAILVLGAVTLIASYLPARSATSVDPIVALRHE